MKKKILDFTVMKEEISQNNVLEMAELIAFMELRFQIGYIIMFSICRINPQRLILLLFLYFSKNRQIPLDILFGLW